MDFKNPRSNGATSIEDLEKKKIQQYRFYTKSSHKIFRKSK